MTIAKIAIRGVQGAERGVIAICRIITTQSECRTHMRFANNKLRKELRDLERAFKVEKDLRIKYENGLKEAMSFVCVYCRGRDSYNSADCCNCERKHAESYMQRC